jgi:hypothetical protein
MNRRLPRPVQLGWALVTIASIGWAFQSILTF